MGAHTINGIKVEIDNYIWNNIQTAKELIKNAFDCVFVVDGMEGSGKSEFAFQWAIAQSDGKFSEKDVFYTAEQFEQWVETAKKGDIGVWDEFVLAGMSTDALSKMQNSIIKMFTIMRSKGLTVLLVIPYLFMLRKYFGVARTRALMHVHTNGLERGYVKFYDYDKKHWMYNYGQKTWLYSPKVTPNFRAHFRVWSEKFLDHGKINERKEDARKSIKEESDSLKLTPKDLESCQQNIEFKILVDQRDDVKAYRNAQRCIKKLKGL